MNPLSVLKEIRATLKDVHYELTELRAEIGRINEVLNYPITVRLSSER